MKFWYDTEFLEDGHTIDLISIGIVSEDGRTYYAVNSDVNFRRVKKHPWLPYHVVPHLPVMNRSILDAFLAAPENRYPKPSIELVELDETVTCVKPLRVITNEVRDFLHASDDWHDNQLWAWYGAYDHVVLAQLFGAMVTMPKHLPRFTCELRQLWEIAGKPEKPEKPENCHDALADALWNRKLYRRCIEALLAEGHDLIVERT